MEKRFFGKARVRVDTTIEGLRVRHGARKLVKNGIVDTVTDDGRPVYVAGHELRDSAMIDAKKARGLGDDLIEAFENFSTLPRLDSYEQLFKADNDRKTPLKSLPNRRRGPGNRI